MLRITFTVVGSAIQAQEPSYLSSSSIVFISSSGCWSEYKALIHPLTVTMQFSWEGFKNSLSQHRNEHLCSFRLVHLLKPHLSFLIYEISMWGGGIIANTVQLSWPSANEISTHTNCFKAPLVESVHNWPVFSGNQ